ncbi:DnaB-like helicase N-terminal domain-containing protein [Streptomyces sp. YIM 98790]|uniref:DnaB-like helicase N-terminal domain-containing protein n=1 Tax=Streptomyces sp. YIM 98790 TaxID=2689077 RepID=UPI0028BE7892|nr:DnaB-like helicase N-terminal domain-containing protein [Streptomyces sp. YIM 98790]
MAEERLLLSALIARPDGLDEVAPWLRPADFALPAHGPLYLCLTALHHRGDPVDSLTLLWEAQRRGLLADGTVTSDEVRDLDTGISAGSVEYLAEQVLRASLLRVAAASARTVRSLAENDALTPGRLIGRALHALRPLDEVSTRWRQATSEPPPEDRPAQPPTRAPSIRAQAARARSQQFRVNRPAAVPSASSATHPARRTTQRKRA